jgi:hypothetical protein
MSAEERAAFIAGRCGNDESMRAEVESLLGQQQHQSSLLESAFAGTLGSSTPEVALGRLSEPYILPVHADAALGGGTQSCPLSDEWLKQKGTA